MAKKVDLEARLLANGCTAETRTQWTYDNAGFLSVVWDDTITDAAFRAHCAETRQRVEVLGHRCPCGEWLPAAATAAQWAGHWRGAACDRKQAAFRMALEEDIAEIARELTAPLEKLGIRVLRSVEYTVGGGAGKRGDVKTDRYVSAESLRDFLGGTITERQRMLAKQALAEHAAIRAGIRPWMREAWKIQSVSVAA